mmetsp:Transcript_3964/g.10912  ORF Transcript_3964/g.10912 Transcript_3964/m.10912 type:complete len:206 (-) Transcript_3964:47-664(-)
MCIALIRFPLALTRFKFRVRLGRCRVVNSLRELLVEIASNTKCAVAASESHAFEFLPRVVRLVRAVDAGEKRNPRKYDADAALDCSGARDVADAGDPPHDKHEHELHFEARRKPALITRALGNIVHDEEEDGVAEGAHADDETVPARAVARVQRVDRVRHRRKRDERREPQHRLRHQLARDRGRLAGLHASREKLRRDGNIRRHL